MSARKLANPINVRSSQAANAAQQISRFLPWGFTGPVSHAEWKDVPVRADRYRSLSPTSDRPSQVTIPQSHNTRIYNTKYYPRDVRRSCAISLNPFTPELHRVKKSNLSEITESLKLPSPVTLTQCDKVGLLDDPNAGYT